MHSDAKKVRIIEEVLKIKNEATLSTLEIFLKKLKKDKTSAEDLSIADFSGIWSKTEAEEIEQIIKESCG